MKALVLNPKTKALSLKEIPEPALQGDYTVKLKVLEVGICGTDREQIAHGKTTPPADEEEIILGHEMLGEVVAVGREVTQFRTGDLAVVTVRRGCATCTACERGRFDLCYSGNYTERGIKRCHGFHAEYVVEEERHLIKVPTALREVGVLTEPLSVVEKALDELFNLQRTRLADWKDQRDYSSKKALVAGLGPIGLLAACVLRLQGFHVFGLDVVGPGELRTRILEDFGGKYIDGRTTHTHNLSAQLGQIDLIFEAAGVAKLDFDLLGALGINGGYVLTGVPHDIATFEINGGKLMHHFVLKNQLALGSVNAARKHWESAIVTLGKASVQWEKPLKALITARISPEKFLEDVLKPAKDTIKTVVSWNLLQ